jgi:hypothetical protein
LAINTSNRAERFDLITWRTSRLAALISRLLFTVAAVARPVRCMQRTEGAASGPANESQSKSREERNSFHYFLL